MKLSLGTYVRDYSVAGGAVAYDADAQAYFTANTAITSAADKNAINTFYLGLKSDGIYTKIKAMYLPIWGSASSSKWNLVNPLDTNGAYRLNFSTGWTFSSSGATPNGTSAYADTFLNAQSVVNSTNHLCYYSRTLSVGTNQVEIGLYDFSNAIFFQIRSAANYISGTMSVLGSFTTTSDARGFWLGTKRSNNDRELYFNGISEKTITANDTSNLPSSNIIIGARRTINPELIELYSNKQCAFASIGNGLTDTEASNFYTRVQTLMTYFGINV